MDESDRENLTDMFRCAKDALRLVGSASEDEFLADEQKVHAVCRVVQIVGEAASRVPASHQALFPGIPWKDVVGMRHRLVHGYREVRNEVIFKTVHDDPPPLIASLETALAGNSR